MIIDCPYCEMTETTPYQLIDEAIEEMLEHVECCTHRASSQSDPIVVHVSKS